MIYLHANNFTFAQGKTITFLKLVWNSIFSTITNVSSGGNTVPEGQFLTVTSRKEMTVQSIPFFCKYYTGYDTGQMKDS